MVRRCWVNIQCRGVLLTWITVGQGPIVLAVGAGGGCLDIFSTPEHEVLMLSYCDQSLSVVRALSTLCFKRLLLQNGWTDFEIILQEGSLGGPLPKLLKPFRSVEQDGRQS